MTTYAGRTIAALRAEHDALAGVVSSYPADQLTGPSGASEWTVADVLSHVGSGAEISLAGFRATLGEAEEPGPDFNQSVWDRWNALKPQDQAAGWEPSDAALLEALEAVPEERHDDILVNVGFLPVPIPLAAFAGLRLSEVSPHAWDVRAGVDRGATLLEDSATLLAEHLSGHLATLLGFIGKADTLGRAAVVEISGSPYSIVIGEKVQLSTDGPQATATFTGGLEAALRLLYGRLGAEYTPATVEVTGNVTLDELRGVFPGF